MKLKLITVGNKMPSWIMEGFNEYQKRLPKDYHFEVKEIPAKGHAKSQSTSAIKEQEGQQILTHIAPKDLVIALDEHGAIWDTKKLAQNIENWQMDNQNVCFMIGGPGGLSSACLKRATQTWSLSRLTFAHPMVRVIFIEQLYRAWSIIAKHPYHRE